MNCAGVVAEKIQKCHLMIEEKIAYHADKGEIVPTRDMLKTIPQIEGIQKVQISILPYLIM